MCSCCISFFPGDLSFTWVSHFNSSERDTHFLGHFWRSVWKLLCTSLYMSIAYHPQTDGKTEITNLVLGNMLWSLVRNNFKFWDSKMCITKFAHNHATNHSSSFFPLKVVYGLILRCPLDLIPLPDRVHIYGQASDFVIISTPFMRRLKIIYKPQWPYTKKMLIRSCSR